MSDSPYSLRHVAERLRAAGVTVVGLRVPGHGTAPVGLTRTTVEDMAAAVRLAVAHLRDRVGDRPIHLVGYSNGAALAVHYALTQLDAPDRPAPDRIVLFSPEIGISPAAALAIWQERIGRLLGLDKLAWNSVLPEYDPYKYQSFAVNAGNQAYRLTRENARLIADLGARDRLGDMPPVLAFQSAVDATVSTTAVIAGLMSRLPAGGHELVLFDLNRWTDIEYLLEHDPAPELLALVEGGASTYTVRVVTNASETSLEIVLKSRVAGQREVTSEPLALRWPKGVFSLSHVALPFPPTDPLYGDARAGPSPGIQLGDVALRGERGVLQVSSADMLRQRSNPFYAFAAAHLVEFLGLTRPAHGPGTDAGAAP
jgi:alpha-beta hydrolase superfamily lysophospholipase